MIRRDRCDYAVIGAGAAGSLVAAGLAAAFPGADIVLVEAGASRPGLVNIVPLLSGFAPFRAGTGWNHRAAGPVGEQLLFQGRMPGGSSEINGMVVSQGEAADYAPWQEAAGPLWSPARCRAAFDRLVGPGIAGRTIARTRTEPWGPLPGAFLEAAAEAGFPLAEDLNDVAGDRFGLTHGNILRGRRQSARSAFLPVRPANLRLLTGARALRLEIRAGRAVAVILEDRDGAIRLETGSETVLTAGALKSAELLLRSGIGPPADLERAGVAPVLDRPEVGQNLQNHPSWAIRLPTRSGSLRGLLNPLNGAPALARWLFSGRGPLAQPIFQAAGYFRPRGAAAPGMAQAVFSPALFPPVLPGQHPRMPGRHGATIAVQQGSPFSRGSVSLAAAGGLSIRTGAFSDPRDAAFLRAAIADLSGIVACPAFRAHLDGPLPAIPDEDQIRQGAGTAYHMAGTARMGRDAGAVTDPELRVCGIDGLRIADSSVMPQIPNAALHFPTMMIAARALEFLTGPGPS